MALDSKFLDSGIAILDSLPEETKKMDAAE